MDKRPQTRGRAARRGDAQVDARVENCSTLAAPCLCRLLGCLFELQAAFGTAMAIVPSGKAFHAFPLCYPAANLELSGGSGGFPPGPRRRTGGYSLLERRAFLTREAGTPLLRS